MLHDTAVAKGGARTGAGPVKSAARALDLLDEISAHGPGTQLQLATRLDIPKSSLHALLRTMTDRGWLQTDPTGSVYQLGIHSLVVGSSYLAEDPIVTRAAPILDELAAATGETVNLGRLDGTHVVYLSKRESVHPLRMHSALGRRLLACSTALGRAILADHPAARREDLVPEVIPSITSSTTTDRSRLLTMLDEVAELGYARESDESCIGVRCFAIALPFSHPTIGGISVAIPVSRLDRGREDVVIETLLSVKARLTAEQEHSFVR